MRMLVDGQEFELEPQPGVRVSRQGELLLVTSEEGTRSAMVVKSGRQTLVSYRGRVYAVEKAGRSIAGKTGPTSGEATAPMPGQIVDVLVNQGEAVAQGQKLLVLEAMKTQQPILAAFDGIVATILVSKGDQVVEGALLIKIQPADS